MSSQVFAPQSSRLTSLTQVDHIIEYIPLVSTAYSLVNLFLKYIWIPLMSLERKCQPYFWHITHKSLARMITALVPVLGNIAILIFDGYQKYHSHKAEKSSNVSGSSRPFTAFQHDNVIDIQSQEDTLVYTNNRHPEYFEKLRNSYNGLSSEETLNDLLQRQEYIEVLNHLWSEGDQNIRISWLEKKLPENHPILICELALEYILRDPSIHTYLFSSRPLLDVALCLTEMDCNCTSDKSVTAAPGFLDFRYGDLIFKALLAHHSRESVQAYWKEHFIEFKNNKFELLRNALCPFLDPQKHLNLPSPRWVFSHGMGAFFNGIDSAAYPENQWYEIRRKAVQKNLNMLLEDEKKMKRDPMVYIRNAFQNID